jgi:galactokinase
MTGSQSLASSELAVRFEEIFGASAKIFRAPGRVNLIGEHTDYNDGFVMPCAIGFSTRVALSPRTDRKLVIRSEDFPQQFEFDLDKLPQEGAGFWCDYVVGVAVTLHNAGYPVQGANLLLRGEVPIGAGLSSSAAVEVASALAMMSLNGTTFPMPDVARICQRAENLFVGAKVGIMDQFVSCLGKAGHALMLDCRSLDFQYIPLPESVRLVICNTMVKHEHSNGEYNRRREECDQGVKLLSKWHPGIRALRDITVQELESHSAELPPLIYKRCLHVVCENQRVLDSASHLKQGNLESFGSLMRDSHKSLRDLYEVSCRELDLMVDLAEKIPGFVGGRMTGGGFGGCTVNLVKTADAQSFAKEIATRYQDATAIKPDVYVCAAASGAGAEPNGN